MRYVYLEITRRKYDGERARLERIFCGIKMHQIAQTIGCHRQSIYAWEKTGVDPITSDRISYQRIAHAIHNHASLDYWPCPTLVKLAPEKWTKYRLMNMRTIRRWYEQQ